MQTQQIVFFKGDAGTKIKTPGARKNERSCAILLEELCKLLFGELSKLLFGELSKLQYSQPKVHA
jgi:hypothetical protein